MNDEIRSLWDEWFFNENSYQLDINYSPWLETYHDLISLWKSPLVLDLGCGRGFDTRFLQDHGFKVISTDYSWGALLSTRKTATDPNLLQFDMREGFPFPCERFGLIIADLSLHYFSATKSARIIKDLQRILIVGGWLIARVNSTNDHNFLSLEKNTSQKIEEDYFFHHGVPRRYFRESTIRQYFSSGWEIDHLEEKVVIRYEKPKAILEYSAHKI